jgi:TnpA family transposase
MDQNEIEQNVVNPNHVILVNITGKSGEVSQILDDGRLSLKLRFLLFDSFLVLFCQVIIKQKSIANSSEETKHEEPALLVTSM